MSIEGSGELINRVKTALGSSSGLLEPEELEFAALQALNELDWNYPLDDSKKQYWAVQRARRHAIDVLRVQSARKFQFKSLSLQHKFQHYHALITELDNKFEKALQEDPALMDIALEGMFGVFLENGIVYDQYGRDVSKYLDYHNVDNNGFRHRIM